MQPLIIIATPNVCWLKPEVDYPRTPEAIAEEAALCLARMRDHYRKVSRLEKDGW